MTTNAIQFVTAEEAADILNKSSHSVRQLAGRGMIETEKRGYRTLVKLDSVMTYHARKKNLPAWETNIRETRNKTFVMLEYAADALKVQAPYVIRLVREKELEGYVTANGEIMVSRESINAYLRKPGITDGKRHRKNEF